MYLFKLQLLKLIPLLLLFYERPGCETLNGFFHKSYDIRFGFEVVEHPHGENDNDQSQNGANHEKPEFEFIRFLHDIQTSLV